MKLARLGTRGQEVPAVVTDDAVLDLRGPDPGPRPGLLRRRTAWPGPRRRWTRARCPELPTAGGLRVGAPLARPGAVICIGMNYAAHAAESGAAPPEHPVVFFKSPNRVGGPDDDVAVPPRRAPRWTGRWSSGS